MSAAVAHDRSHLIFSRFELFCRRHLDEHNDRTPRAVRLLVGRVRHVDDVVTREAEYRSQRLEHTENKIWTTVDTDLLADGLVRRCVGKQVLEHVRTDHADLASGVTFALGPDPSYVETDAVDVKHRDR